MDKVNIAEFKNNISKIIVMVEKGNEIEICKRNIPIAMLSPIKPAVEKNHTRLGCGKGSVKIIEDLTEPMIPEEDWDMMKR